jgi:hypothetical protein
MLKLTQDLKIKQIIIINKIMNNKEEDKTYNHEI